MCILLVQTFFAAWILYSSGTDGEFLASSLYAGCGARQSVTLVAEVGSGPGKVRRIDVCLTGGVGEDGWKVTQILEGPLWMQIDSNSKVNYSTVSYTTLSGVQSKILHIRGGLRGGGGVGMGVSGMVFVGLVLGCIEAKFCK